MGDGKREETIINDGDPLINATAEEIEVAGILLELPYLIGGTECRLWSCFTWGARKSRTGADSDDTAGSSTRVESSSSPATTSLPYPPRTEEEDIELPGKNVDQVSSGAKPLSLSPPRRHQSEDKPKNLKKKGSSKKMIEELLGENDKFSKEIEEIKVENEKVQNYLDKLKSYNLALKARKAKFEKPHLEAENSLNLETELANDQHQQLPASQFYQQPIIFYQTAEPLQLSIASGKPHEFWSPVNISDLNLPAKVEVGLDFGAKVREAAEARRRRRTVCKLKGTKGSTSTKPRDDDEDNTVGSFGDDGIGEESAEEPESSSE